jgi:hypothetical protein
VRRTRLLGGIPLNGDGSRLQKSRLTWCDALFSGKNTFSEMHPYIIGGDEEMAEKGFKKLTDRALADTLDTQMGQIKTCARQDGIEIITVYSEQVSGSGKKPGIDQLLRDAQNGNFQMLYVYTLRQLSAHRDAAREIIDRLHALGTEVKVVNPNIDLGTLAVKPIRHKFSAFSVTTRETNVLEKNA